MNDIISWLGLEDSDIEVLSIEIADTSRIVTLGTRPAIRFCPICGFRMHSKGVYTRTINHPIFQDGFYLVIRLKQRRWKCTGPSCTHEENESFNFIRRHCRNTNSTALMIVNEFRDLSQSAADIARKFRISDTHALEIFSQFVDLPRLPLSDAVCIDEVYLNMDDSCKYVLVLQDFHTGEPIDLVRSRKSDVTEPYFASIPKEERFRVKYLISDMYNEYIRYVGKYFPNAIPVVDSFHVVQWINFELDRFVRNLLNEINAKSDEEMSAKKKSDAIYLLKNYRFFLLSGPDKLQYHEEPHIDRHFRYYMNTYDYERAFFNVDPNLPILRDLRNEYLHFNVSCAGNTQRASQDIVYNGPLVKTTC